MENQIEEAIKLLRQNDYAVIKMTKAMLEDTKKCDELGGDKECFGCSCNICVN